MFKKFSCWVLSILMVLTMLPVEVMAEEVSDVEVNLPEVETTLEESVPTLGGAPAASPTELSSGSCGTNVGYALYDDGSLVISGTGAMDDFANGSAPWYNDRTTIKKVTIESGVTSVSNEAFTGCTALTTVTLPEGITSIGTKAFYQCSLLNGIILPESVNSIGSYAFYQCSALASVEMPQNMNSIGSYAFFQCSALVSIEVPAGVSTIGDYTFYGCTSLETVELPESVTSIGSYAFYGCARLKNAVLPSQLASIGSSAFESCDTLTTMDIPGSVTSIGFSAFQSCKALQTVVFHEGTSYVGNYMFTGYNSLKTVTIPASVKDIRYCAFSGCSSLTTVNYLGTAAQWAKISISDGNSSLINATRYYGPTAETITIVGATAEHGSVSASTANVTKGGRVELTITPEAGYMLESLTADYGTITGTILTLPAEGDYTTVTLTATFAKRNFGDRIIRDGGSCGDGTAWVLFADGELLVYGYGPMDNFNNNSDPWFNYRADVKSISVEQGVTALGNSAFSGCANATSVSLPEGLTTVGNNAFYGCTSLQAITVPTTVISVGEYVFYNCTALRQVSLPEGIPSLGSHFFYGCTALETVDIPTTVKSIGSCAFYGCTALQSITIPEGITKIYSHLFHGCTKLQEVSLPDSVTSIGNDAFSYCQSLEKIYLPANLTLIDEEAFYNTGLIGVVLPEGLTNLGSYSNWGYIFSQCNHLRYVVLPKSISLIACYCFPSSLQTVYYTGTSKQWANISISSDNDSLLNAKRYYVSEDDLLPVTVSATEHGTVSVAELTIRGGELTVGIKPDTGYRLKTLTVDHGTVEGNVITVATGTNFDSVAVSATFEAVRPGKTVVSGGSCGDSASWVLYSDGELVVYGYGGMSSSDNTIPYTYKSSVRTVSIESGITSIGSYAFYECGNITEITIPAGITAIGNNAFQECYGLKSITIPASVTSISNNAFSYCSNLRTVYYLGTAAQWANVSVGSSGNNYLTNATHYNISSPDDIVTVSISSSDHGSVVYTGVAIKGYSFTVTVSPEAGYKLDSLTATNATVNGTTVTVNSTGDFDTVELTATFSALRPNKTLQNSGTCGTNVNWYLYTDGELVISGTGDMTNCGNGSAPWYNDRETIKSITVEAGVTSIGNGAFYDCQKMKGISIADTVITIGHYAFYNCDGLISIILPSELSTLREGAFANCSSLVSIEIPGSVSTVSYSAFEWCTALTGIKLHPGTTQIYERAFYGCNALKHVYYYGTQEQWAATTVCENNSRLTGAQFHYIISEDDIVEIKTTVPAHGTISVEGCVAVKGENFTVSVTPEEGYKLDHLIVVNGTANGRCVSVNEGDFTEITIGAVFAPIRQNKTLLNAGTCGASAVWALYTDGELVIAGDGQITDNPWQYNRDDVKTLTVENGITYISDYAFNCLTNLTSVWLPDSVTTLMYGVFSDCNRLQEIRLPTQLKRIERSTFRSCNQLTHISLPDELTYIGNDAFSYCFNLAQITIPDGVTALGERAFQCCYKLTGITVPGSVLSIGESAFNDCTMLQSVQLKDGIRSIGSNAFTGCTALTDLSLTTSITSVGNGAFNGCTNLQNICYFGTEDQWNAVTIESNNFCLKNATRRYVDTDNVVDIVVMSCQHGTISVAGGVGVRGGSFTVTISPETGYKLESLSATNATVNGATVMVNSTGSFDTIELTATFVSLRAGKTVVAQGTSNNGNIMWTFYDDGEMVFTGSGTLIDQDWSDNWGWSGDSWVAYRDSITSVSVEDGITEIGYRAFHEFCNLKSVTLPISVTSIAYGAFQNCYNLKSVSLPESVTSIAYYAFGACNSLRSITIPSHVTSIGSAAFVRCYSLEAAEFMGDAPENFSGDTFLQTSSEFAIYYHASTTGWTTPSWNGYTAVCVDPISDYSTLNDNNYNAQGIFFKLNVLARTAVVGNGSLERNSCGYAGGQQGAVIIPDTVTKGSITYKVIAINENAFLDNLRVKTVTLGANVSSVAASAFQGCENLTAFIVDSNSSYFKSYDGVLYDASGLNLYCYPAARAGATYSPLATCHTIGEKAFYGANNLSKLTIANTVTSIGARAFSYCGNLKEITLPFVGGNATGSQKLSYVFDLCQDDYTWELMSIESGWATEARINYFYSSMESGHIPFSLTTVTVLTANLSQCAFADCCNLEAIYFPNCYGLTTIPEYCFSGCSNLATVLFSKDKTATQAGAFISQSIATFAEGAFAGCNSIEQFAVASENTAFTVDPWGVLYSKNMAKLYYYPAAREWPYYNISDSTTTVGAYAFDGCSELVNLYIPESVTAMEDESVRNCPLTTICTYCNSSADVFASANNIHLWYMDNCTIQGIEVINLPDQIVLASSSQQNPVLYAANTYKDENGQQVQLQVEECSVEYEKAYGKQMVTLYSGGYSTTFETTVLRKGDINGDSTLSTTNTDVTDMQCLYDYLSTGESDTQIEDDTYFQTVADVNGDSSVNILDYQALYDLVK